MKQKINYRLKKYPQSFFDFNNYKTATYKRYKHRLIAWYLLHEYSIDHALIHLAKYTDILRVLKNEFRDYVPEIENLYDFNLSGKYKSYFKHTLLNNKICKICAKRVLTKSDYCSQSCANKGKDNSKISEALKKYYSRNDYTERYKKVSKTLINTYKNMSPEEKEYLKINGKPRSYKLSNKIKDIEKEQNVTFLTDSYSGHNSKIKFICNICNVETEIKYSKINRQYLCKNCKQKLVDENNFKKYKDILDKKLELMEVKDNIAKVKCSKHGIYYTNIANVRLGSGCPICNTTKAELELRELITNYKSNDRTFIKPLELDLFVPDKNFAIEYNGIMYHSFGKSKHSKFNTFMNEREDKNKHLVKTELCESKGVQLFHIFENEWLNPVKREIWKSMILSKLGKSSRIFARKCSVKEISHKESSEFLELNHIQGNVNAKIKIGLFKDNELVQVMTISKPRMSKKYQYEIIRIASILGTVIVGGVSKMLRYFERLYKPKSIVSYANRRWSMGNVYEKLGFRLDHISMPNYFYFKKNENILYSRNKFQKHKLKNILQNFDENLTETENMYINGYRKIYDSGNLVYDKFYT